LLTLAEAARAVGLPYQTVHAAWMSGRIPYSRLGRLILVKLEDVQEAMKGHRPARLNVPIVRPS
jgi:excisionase family DNA binding protein